MNTTSPRPAPVTFTPYALSLQLAALHAELAGFGHVAAAFRALLQNEVRRFLP